MKTKKTSNTLWCLYQADPEVIEDNGLDGYENYSVTDEHQEFTGVSIDKPTKTWDYEAIEVDFVPKAGMDVYVAYVKYANGSTFGQSRGYICFLGVFETEMEARRELDRAEKGPHPQWYRYNDYFGGPESFDFEVAKVT